MFVSKLVKKKNPSVQISQILLCYLFCCCRCVFFVCDRPAAIGRNLWESCGEFV